MGISKWIRWDIGLEREGRGGVPRSDAGKLEDSDALEWGCASGGHSLTLRGKGTELIGYRNVIKQLIE